MKTFSFIIEMFIGSNKFKVELLGKCEVACIIKSKVVPEGDFDNRVDYPGWKANNV